MCTLECALNEGNESGKGKALAARLQLPEFPCARPRMCRLEVWVAALILVEAHSHTLSSF